MEGSAERKSMEDQSMVGEQVQSTAMPEKFDLGFILARAKEVSLNPTSCWTKLRGESASPRSMYLGYIVFLSAVPIVCEFLRMITIGRYIPLVGTYKWPLFSGLGFSIFQYLLGLVMIGVVAFISEKLANNYFEGKTDLANTLKLVAYAATPVWLLGVLNLIPFLSVLVIFAGLYGLYLLYQGIPAMTGVRAEKRLGYLAATLVCSVICGLIIGIPASIFAPSLPTPDLSNSQLKLPAGVSVDMDKFQKTMEDLQRLAPDGANK